MYVSIALPLPPAPSSNYLTDSSRANDPHCPSKAYESGDRGEICYRWAAGLNEDSSRGGRQYYYWDIFYLNAGNALKQNYGLLFFF